MKAIVQIFSLLIILHLLPTLNGLQEKYFFCGRRIYSDDYKLSTNDIEDLCHKINLDDRFLILMQKNINAMEENMYTRDTEEFFVNNCKVNGYMCDYGFAISIYTGSRKIRISAGRISKNVATMDKLNTVITSMKTYLKDERYGEGIRKAMDLIRSYAPYYYNQSPTPVSTVRPEHDQSPPKHSGGISFLTILLFVICPCICICGIIYYFYKKKEEQSNFPDRIHNHLRELEGLIKEIRMNYPHQMVSIDRCLICMERIIMNRPVVYEMTNLNQFSTTRQDNFQQHLIPVQIQDNLHTRFACGHVYHSQCLARRNLGSCLMCIGNMNSTGVIPNTQEVQVVTEFQIKNLIQNFHLLYDQWELNEYATTYPNEFDTYNTSLALGLVAAWGVTAVAVVATAAVVESYNYNSNSSGVYQPEPDTNPTYNYNYPPQDDGNPETASGDY